MPDELKVKVDASEALEIIVKMTPGIKMLIELGKEIATQNNRITDAPIFVVQEKRRLYGVDSDSHEEQFCWFYDGEEVTDKRTIRSLNIWRQKNDRDKDDYERVHYIDQWRAVTFCFTEKGCKEYIRLNGHNLKEARIYAESSYRNNEFRAIRDLALLLYKGSL